MPRMLVLYATTDGQTQKIADALGDTLRATGLDVDVIEVGGADPEPSQYAGVIVAAPVRAGRYDKALANWVRAHVDRLQMPTAFVSVCLSVLSKNEAGRQESIGLPRRFVEGLNWHPDVIKPVAGALLYTQYNFFIRWIMKRIVAKAGGDTDTSRDYEYTDWNDVRSFAREFSGRLRKAAA